MISHVKTVMLSIVLILSNATTNAVIKPGLQVLQQYSLQDKRRIYSEILTGLIGEWKETSYKLQILRMKVGFAWELVFTDYGFQKQA